MALYGSVEHGIDIAAISAELAVTAVDVFVYDTSKDSDGGAWRNRCQHTSWYNETLNTSTRGSRREFPAVAVIVAESNRVTIYDGDDPALPMWMVSSGSCITGFALLGVTSLYMMNGLLVIGQNDSSGSNNYDGIRVLDFIRDSGFWTWLQSNSSAYNSVNGLISGVYNVSGSGTYPFLINTGQSIINREINDVAMTVLPNAPVDPATGLPIPTIAVATNGGVSVIKDDGTVVDITETTGPNSVHRIGFRNNKLGFYTSGTAGISGFPQLYYLNIPDSDITSAYFYANISLPGWEMYGGFWESQSTDKLILNSRTSTTLSNFDSNYIGNNIGLNYIVPEPENAGLGAVSYITSSYNTGLMHGDIKGAFLSDTDDTDLVGEDLAVNGTFDTDASGWTLGTDWQYDAVNQRLSRVGSTYHNAIPNSTIANLVIGESYTFEVESGGGAVGYYTASGVYAYLATGITRISFTYKGGNYPFFFSSSTDGWIDNFKVFRSSHDRSVNADGKRASDLIVNGTITRTAVATGADLVAYSGFSSTNYLEQPYNSALDFGTGDFSMMCWAIGGGDIQTIVVREWESGDSEGSILIFQNHGRYYVYIRQSGTSQWTFLDTGIAYGNYWSHICLTRKDGVFYGYVNGILRNSVNFSGDVSNTSAKLRVGRRLVTTTTQNYSGSVALVRISGTAPTAEQIAKIYEDEKVLFQENAKATLYGASDAVTALAYDDKTNLLHVGTSAGRSVFSGLRRVDNTTTAVGTAISAYDGLVAEE